MKDGEDVASKSKHVNIRNVVVNVLCNLLHQIKT